MKTIKILIGTAAALGFLASCETEVAVVEPTRTTVTTEETVTTRTTPYGTVQTQTVQTY